MTILASIRNTQRLAEVIGCLIKFGFEKFVDDTGLDKFIDKYVPFIHKPILNEKVINQPLEVRLRMLLENLGPTYIKLGQILSTRPDLVPQEIADEFKKLQNGCPKSDFSVIKERLEQEFEQPLEDLFDYIEEEPLAAGSLAQTHRATLKDGSKVVLKVIKPKVAKIVAADMAVLRELARFVESHFTQIGYNPVLVVKEISKQLTKELDLVQEGRNTERLGEFFRDNDQIFFPMVYWETTTHNILTLEEIHGTLLSNMDLSTLSDEIKQKIVANGTNAVYRMCLECGLFHADPHPGNIFVLPEGKLCFIDCGMTGQIEEDTLLKLAELVKGVLKKDLNKVIRIVISLANADPELETNRPFRESAFEVISKFHVNSLENLDLIKLIRSLFDVLREYQICCPADLVYLIKAMATIQGVGQEIDPDFDIVSHVKPLVYNLVEHQFGLTAIKDRILKGIASYIELIEDIPNEFRSVFTQLRRHHFKIRLEHDELAEFKQTVNRSSKLIAVSMIISAIIIGSGSLQKVSGWKFITVIGVTGLILGCIFCVVLIWEIICEKKK